MSQDIPENVSRRSLLKTTSLGIAGVPVIGTLTEGVAAADNYPYDKIKNKEDSTTIRYTKNAVWHNNVQISVSSTLQHIGSKYTPGDKRWNHKFGINTQAVAYHTDADELRSNIKNQSTKAKKLGGV